jgi:hypothetical protein
MNQELSLSEYLTVSLNQELSLNEYLTVSMNQELSLNEYLTHEGIVLDSYRELDIH